MADPLIEALAQHNDELVAALKTVVTAEVRVVVEGTDIVGLNLDDTKVTDEALEKLTDLNKLRWLGLVRTNVTPEGIEKLQKALPDCAVLA
tara:strand:+ start:1208 stop:1480 length:273 start_codon:yes stop_codon:yes gene_type:complete